MTTDKTFPDNWQIAHDFDPDKALMDLKGRKYLNVQGRMVWFIRDQRALIVAGLATQPYHVLSEMVELDRERGFAHFRAIVTDVLGNQSVAYGSETAKDFGDYIEKAATKALGRALIGLGYGTQFAPEISEGEETRPVDSPVERRAPQSTPRPAPRPAPVRPVAPTPKPAAPAASAALRGGPTEWMTDTGYNPLADAALRKRLAVVGLGTVDLVEQELAVVRAHGDYTREAVYAHVERLEAGGAASADLTDLPVGVRGN